MLFTALHRYLGESPGAITDAMLDAAVLAELAEAHDLDWKSVLPPASKLNETDFPKDVAAMANSGGGVIVYGVTEKDKKATGRNDTGNLTEIHERTLRAAAYSAISPPVLGLVIERLGEVGNQAVAIVIPDSHDGPHLIFRDKYFGAPLRNDADTEWMQERQIEASYRARLEGMGRAVAALEELYDEADTNWVVPGGAWMILVARPRLRSTTAERPTRNQAVQIFQNGANLGFVYAGGGLHPMQMLDWGNPRPGLRRWVGASWAVKDDMSWRAGWAAIHDDGSVSFAARVGGHRVSRTEAAPPNDIAETAVETVVADFMGVLKATAEHYGLGEYDVRAGIESREQARIVIQTTNFRGFAYDAESTPLVRYTPITTSVYADASSDDFYRQVEVLALECVNQGGVRDLTHINAPET